MVARLRVDLSSMVRVRMPMLTLMRAAALWPWAWAPMASSAVWAAWLMRRYSRFWRIISSFRRWSWVRPMSSSSVFLPISVFCTISCSIFSLSLCIIKPPCALSMYTRGPLLCIVLQPLLRQGEHHFPGGSLGPFGAGHRHREGPAARQRDAEHPARALQRLVDGLRQTGGGHAHGDGRKKAVLQPGQYRMFLVGPHDQLQDAGRAVQAALGSFQRLPVPQFPVFIDAQQHRPYRDAPGRLLFGIAAVFLMNKTAVVHAGHIVAADILPVLGQRAVVRIFGPHRRAAVLGHGPVEHQHAGAAVHPDALADLHR